MEQNYLISSYNLTTLGRIIDNPNYSIIRNLLPSIFNTVTKKFIPCFSQEIVFNNQCARLAFVQKSIKLHKALNTLFSSHSSSERLSQRFFMNLMLYQLTGVNKLTIQNLFYLSINKNY